MCRLRAEGRGDDKHRGAVLNTGTQKYTGMPSGMAVGEHVDNKIPLSAYDGLTKEGNLTLNFYCSECLGSECRHTHKKFPVTVQVLFKHRTDRENPYMLRPFLGK